MLGIAFGIDLELEFYNILQTLDPSLQDLIAIRL